MKLNNPFVIAGYESPDYFCDRERETADLIEAVENDRNVTLMGCEGHHIGGFRRTA